MWIYGQQSDEWVSGPSGLTSICIARPLTLPQQRLIYMVMTAHNPLGSGVHLGGLSFPVGSGATPACHLVARQRMLKKNSINQWLLIYYSIYLNCLI